VTAYDLDLLALPCETCRAAEGDKCRYPTGEIRVHLPCLTRLQDRDRAQDEADRKRVSR
jgi:hypothetical protein